MFATITKPLENKLPTRHWYQTKSGGWASRAWTVAEYKEAMKALTKRVNVSLTSKMI